MSDMTDTWPFDNAGGIPCNRCVHNRRNGTCEAFPNGIPSAILGREISHLEPLPEQQNSIVFEVADAPLGNPDALPSPT